VEQVQGDERETGDVRASETWPLRTRARLTARVEGEAEDGRARPSEMIPIHSGRESVAHEHEGHARRDEHGRVERRGQGHDGAQRARTTRPPRAGSARRPPVMGAGLTCRRSPGEGAERDRGHEHVHDRRWPGARAGRCPEPSAAVT
jgi:hypothetical protein